MELKIRDSGTCLTFTAEEGAYRIDYRLSKMMLVSYLKPAALVVHIVTQLQWALNIGNKHEAAKHAK